MSGRGRIPLHEGDGDFVESGPREREPAGAFDDGGKLYDDGDGALPSSKIAESSSGIGDYVGSRRGPSERRLGREQRRRPESRRPSKMFESHLPFGIEKRSNQKGHRGGSRSQESGGAYP